MTQPTPPIDFDRPFADVRPRFAAAVTVDREVVDRVRSVCPSLITEGDALVEAGRDWWPLTMMWARHGTVPALPAAIARPATAGQVAEVLAICNDEHVPVTAVAGRSGVSGGSLPVFGGIALDACDLSGIVAVDDDSLVIDVRAGTFGVDLERELREQHGLTLGHWPQSIDLSTVGGWLACRSAGQYSTRYGKIEDMVTGLEVALADGRLLRTGGRGPRAATGPDLTQLFVGSEGTLGVITEAQFRVHPAPQATAKLARSFTGDGHFAQGLDACRRILRRGATPAVLRLYDHRESKRTFSIEDASVLIVLDEGDPELVGATMRVVEAECTEATALDNDLVDHWLERRNDVSALGSVIERGVVVDTIEIAGRWSALPAIYDAAISAVRAVPGTFTASAHQSHAYTDGACLYFTFAGQSPDGDNDRYYVAAFDAITRATLAHGGALSHHHGVGLNRAHYMPDALGQAFDVLVAVKNALDPNGILNPGKLGFASPFGTVPWP